MGNNLYFDFEEKPIKISDSNFSSQMLKRAKLSCFTESEFEFWHNEITILGTQIKRALQKYNADFGTDNYNTISKYVHNQYINSFCDRHFIERDLVEKVLGINGKMVDEGDKPMPPDSYTLDNIDAIRFCVSQIKPAKPFISNDV